MIISDFEVHDPDALKRADKILAEMSTASRTEIGEIPPWIQAARTAVKEARQNDEDNQ